MDELRVREMVLYKHGVGFFKRQGEFEGEQIRLSFRETEINDILKSLTVFDRQGGYIVGVQYPTPDQRDKRMQENSVHLSDERSLRDFIISLRGRQVECVVGSSRKSERVRGRMLGLDEDPQRPTISLLTQDDEVQTFLLKALRSVRLLDSTSQNDLTYFLDASMEREREATITIRLNDGLHELVAYYLAPAPTWRVSYRLIGEKLEEGTAGRAVLQGWGIFDNQLEDLTDVRVTLVAGQPISFVYELAESLIPERPHVRDESRVAPGPIEYEQMYEAALDEAPAFRRAPAPKAASVLSAARMGKLASAPPPPPPTTETRDAGETFQYIVTTPVSVKRGESALVPILSIALRYERELLYNQSKLANHPVAALRFTNESDLTLERGPVTFIEDDDYKGEAVLSFSKPSETLYLPYSVELSIQIRERQQRSRQTRSVRLEGAFLVYEEYETEQVEYEVTNRGSEERVVTIEAERRPGAELIETATPDAQDQRFYRWRITAKASSATKFSTQQRTLVYRRTELEHLDETHLDLPDLRSKGLLDDANYEKLRQIFDLSKAVKELEARQAQLTARRSQILEEQEQYRRNLTALRGDGGKEGALRDRILQQLEASQNQLNAVQKENEDSESKAELLLRRLDALVKTLEER